MTCPTADELLGFLAGHLAADPAAAIEVHMDICASCRATVSNLVRGSLPEPRFGRYQIETVLGDGGMGIVYRAFDPQLERAVAIKVVKTSDHDEALRARLVREAQSLARLSHPNVCQVYDAGRDGEEVWVAMELIDGVDLRLWAATHSAAEIEAALVSAAQGIAAAHAAGLIHRDVKPENVLVTRAGRTVVTDFGLARGPDAPVTSAVAGMASGTPAYMAPEQLTAAALDARVDQFAWAVMAWELLTGERPFPVEAVARLAAIRAGVAPPHRLPARIAHVLTRALASAPRDRFESMDAVLDALAQPTARPPRRRMIAAAIAAIAVALAVVAPRLADGPSADRAVAAVSAQRVLSGPAAAPAPSAPVESAAAAPQPLAAEPPDSGSPAVAVQAPSAASPPIGASPPPPAMPSPSAAPKHAPRRDSSPVPSGAASRAAPPAREPQIAAAPRLPGPAAEAPPARTPSSPYPDDDPAPPPPARAAHFDRAHAERILADCRFPLDPARPERALSGLGAIVDWGQVARRELVRSPDGRRRVIYEVQGSRGRYPIDAGGMPQLGVLDAEVGDTIVVCPYERPGIATLPSRTPPFQRPAPQTVYAFAPADVVPRIASELRSLAPLHLPEAMLRTFTTGDLPGVARRALLVWARPVRTTAARWEMNGWSVEVGDLVSEELALADGRAPFWLVVDRVRVEGSPANRQVITHGLRALRSLLR